MDPRRGEIWMVDLNPTKGDEKRKVRPCLVIGVDGLSRLNLVAAAVSLVVGYPG